MRRANESWPPVTRSGIGGSSSAALGEQASDNTSALRWGLVALGPRCATAGEVAASSPTVIRTPAVDLGVIGHSP
jgi:hypothetical protein